MTTTNKLRETALATVLWFNDRQPETLPEGTIGVLCNLWNAACEVPPEDEDEHNNNPHAGNACTNVG